MINHFRTLLANQPARAGVVYVDPNFLPQVIPTALQPLYKAFIPPGLATQSQDAAVFAALQLAHAPDFEWLTLAFDTRYTYAVNDPSYLRAVASGTAVPWPSFDKLHQTVVTAAVQAESVGALFKSVNGYDDNIATLRTRYNAASSRTSQVTAGLIALVYQLHSNYYGTGYART